MDKQDLITLNRLDEVLVVKRTDQAAQITAVVTRSGPRSAIRTTSDPQSLREEVVRDLRIDRIRQAHDEEAWISGLKKYLNGDLQDLTQQEAKSFANLAADYDLDHHNLLFYCPSTRPTDADRDKLMRLVIPKTLYQDILHHYHVAIKGSAELISGSEIISIGEVCIRASKDTWVNVWIVKLVRVNLGSKESRQDLDQRDWDEYAERITFAINTAHDRIRGETPFYIVHGWDPRSTLEAVIPVGSTRSHDRDPRRWRYRTQRYYQQDREQVNQRLREAISDRPDLHNQEIRPHQIEVGSRVWLYLDRVKEGYAKKLAHLWHGQFRIIEKVGEHAVKLEIAGSGYHVEIAGSGYHIFPMVHVNKLKPKLKLVKEYPDRPLMRLNVECQDRLDFDEDLLPGDSWIQNRDPDEYEVEKITDMRSGRGTRYGRIYREFLVNWRGYDEPTWVDEADLNCGALLHEFLRDRTNHNRFGVMQSHEES
ncbi:Reverse transcriptase [Phytophthora palmivora]|uniref:Reverse transcriptase n=1 Tax=Phytophthora palmivora TaxID=4796 RepID=A0A2P4XZW8_9STRA|nr:Reverse transcriptase [Phytophthora palmivora]